MFKRAMVALTVMSAVLATALPASADARKPPDPHMGVGIHPEDFKVFDLNGRLLFVDDRAILSLIGTFEGPDGYDTIYNGSRVKPEKPITTMTIEEVQDWQRRSVKAGARSSAAGVYQFIQDSLRDTVKKADIPRSALFDRFTQDRMARSALRNCGFYRHDVADSVIGDCLAGTWAALPLITGPNAGKSRYQGVAGNKSLTSIETVMRTIKGRFRDVAHARDLMNLPTGEVAVQRITGPVPSAQLVKERSTETGEIVFSVSEPDPELLARQREQQYRTTLDERAEQLRPFSGYVRADTRGSKIQTRIYNIPSVKK